MGEQRAILWSDAEANLQMHVSKLQKAPSQLRRQASPSGVPEEVRMRRQTSPPCETDEASRTSPMQRTHSGEVEHSFGRLSNQRPHTSGRTNMVSISDDVPTS